MNQLIASLMLNMHIFYLGYRWLLQPKMHLLGPASIVVPILLLHGICHLCSMISTPGVMQYGMPEPVAVLSAIGDFIAAALAMTTAFLIQQKQPEPGRDLVFNLVGSLDFLRVITLIGIFQTGTFIGGVHWIPAWWVPMLIVGHWVIFQVLRGFRRDDISRVA